VARPEPNLTLLVPVKDFDRLPRFAGQSHQRDKRVQSYVELVEHVFVGAVEMGASIKRAVRMLEQQNVRIRTCRAGEVVPGRRN